jgi:hypothetical protein
LNPTAQLFLAVSIPTLVSLIGLLFNRSDYKELSTELKNFRLEMAEKLGAINVRLAIIETKMGIAPPAKTEPTKEVAA